MFARRTASHPICNMWTTMTSSFPIRMPILRFFCALATVCALAMGPATAEAQRAKTDEAAARAAAERMINEAHSAIRSSSQKRLETVIRRNFNFTFWERFILGSKRMGMNDAQLKTFRQALPAYIARLYKNQLAGGGAKPKLEGVRTARGDVYVKARIPRNGAKPIPAEWRMRGAKRPKVIDIQLGPISFLVLKRNELRSVAKREGVDMMLTRMQQAGGR